jgi:hypothetical protein
MNDRRQSQVIDDPQVRRREASFQQQDRPVPARIARPHRFVQIEQCQSVGIGEAAHRPLEAVAIGIGFHHGPDLARAGMPARDRKVVPQRSNVDGGEDRARHADSVQGTQHKVLSVVVRISRGA